MKKTTGMSDAEVVSEIERYIVWPGQACSYKVGMIKILDLRERAKDQMGDSFDIRDFHSAVLDHGEPPLFIVEVLPKKKCKCLFVAGPKIKLTQFALQLLTKTEMQFP